MQRMQTSLPAHAVRLSALWERMVRAIGIHTVNVLLERAIWEASQTHPELALIERTDGGLSFDTVESAYAGRPEAEINAAFSDLHAELSLILARLLGREMAQRITEQLESQSEAKDSAGLALS